MSEEWVELQDGTRKIIMTRRELTNLAHRISRIFAHARHIEPPIDSVHLRGNALAIVPIFTASTLRSPEHHAGGNGAVKSAESASQRGQALSVGTHRPVSAKRKKPGETK